MKKRINAEQIMGIIISTIAYEGAIKIINETLEQQRNENNRKIILMYLLEQQKKIEKEEIEKKEDEKC